jgi:hypothetical protein
MQQSRFGICRFSWCDEAASATVGIVPLCSLHQSYILQLMDRGIGPAGESNSADVGQEWPLISVGDLDI